MVTPSESKIHALVFSAFRESHGRAISLDDLEKKSGVEKAVVKNSIKYLRESGVEIDIAASGYTLSSLPDIILPPVLQAGLKSRVMGREVHCYKSVSSTNELAKRLADSNAPEGALVISEKQTRGRGRLGRSWHSPSGLGLYFSIILRPQLDFTKMPALSLVAALSICRVLDKYTGEKSLIKWPNDCLLKGKKVAGILVELSAELDRVSYAILGIGINVNDGPNDFPSRLKSKATSICMIAGKKIDRAELLRDFLYEFEKSYSNFHRYGLRFLGPELVKRSAVLGQKINITLGKKKIVATAIGFDQNGALRIRDKNGVTIIAAGEVSLR
ncbi:MAG TPA: biotin--[acetyl-CoA-carboxylase] ligase [candidate division Zixibacteria bacterium]|nr:biotin--[acetyl-CoA-carboxylase] ligase [candidate division Zixibacteria bacterium]